ncbi:MAG: FAD-dependent oxidoreductase [Acidobacteriota bacterium]
MTEKYYRMHLIVCGGTACVSNKSFEIKRALEKEIKKHNLEKEIAVITSGCNGFCETGPLLLVKPDNIYYNHLQEKDIPYLVEEHLLKGRPVKKLMFIPPSEEEVIPKLSDIDFFKKQILIALRNRGLIDAEKIEDYIARDGYKALSKALTEMNPEEIINEIKDSGLRGRGGAGFPTGVKWEIVRKAEGSPKYIICNGDEGDPGAYMDRSIIESDPHSLLEGMLIGAIAIGAEKGFIYIRNEYPLAIKRMQTAIKQAEEYGLLGEDILGTGVNFTTKVIRGAGAFICGEETSLIVSIEGRLGEPRPRPPYPAEAGLWGKPTNINNVETWANVPVIIERGAKWFSSIGTALSKGTKVFSVVGKVKNTGLVEIPMGMPIGEIIFDICGGIYSNRKFKSVQIGGPSGGCIPAKLLNLPVDYEQLVGAGAMMGSGGMVVTDENTCMVDMAHFFLTFTKDESCGKCTPCREGISQMLEILFRIKKGEAEMEDLELLQELATTVKETSLCGLGKTAPNPVLTTLRYFKNEYISHIKYKHCNAGVCTHLVPSPCMNSCPINTEASSFIAYIAQENFNKAYEVNLRSNPLPSVCSRVCHHPCEIRCRAGEIGEPIAIRALKRFVIDRMYSNGGPPQVKPFPLKYDEKVAIVGSGPAGLMAGWELRKKGYGVTIFESENVPGGMLAWAIPDYRLPKDILQKEIDNIKKCGVEIKTGVKVGKDISLNDLISKGFKAVFIATGATLNRRLDIPGQETEGIVDPLVFLKQYNLNKKAKIGKKIAVIGGGNTAIDAARTAWRLGADVTILYRRTKSEMPAIPEEIEEALKEGVKIEFLTLPVEIISENGRLKKIKCQRMSLGEFDSSGRRKPVPVKGSDFELEVDTLMPAIGLEPDLSVLKGNMKLNITKWNTLEVDPDTSATNVLGVFAGGDVVTGPATVLEAMQSGKKAAASIHRYLRGETSVKKYMPLEIHYKESPAELTAEEPLQIERPRIPKISVTERRGNFREIEACLDQASAVMEAKRCFRCDLENIRLTGGLNAGEKALRGEPALHGQQGTN